MIPRLVTAAVIVLAVTPGPAAAQNGTSVFDRPLPFEVGETATYDVTFGPMRVGRARLAVEAIESLGGISAYRLVFEMNGGPFFFKIDDRTVSWLATDPYRSLRFEQVLHQGGYERHRRYELDHDAATFVREDWDEEAGAYRPHETERDIAIPAGALDEISFLYLVRTLPLEVGRTYTFENYFQASGNPVVVEVLRRERVRVRAGSFDTIVIRPIIQTDGIFGEGGKAELFISDDESRTIVQLRTQMKVGEMNMYLRELEVTSS
ncbi:MAG: DUF3108 domain-containing protein [Gemmatimonadota bacterium]